ncbi:MULTISPECIES: FISUMP domain-containing protein [Bacteroides]|uniref:DUF1566 domain-containing protein n=2 Tax=Bacteroides fragilis TaxID=817 RepID=A0AAE6C3T1_BACFG|nr:MULTISPECIES: FISUMP domain-containing protein [Bacteroides]MCE8672947.1 fimbrillin family protein [Bacteroides fragilis]MDK2381117.1 FISUMP domain-containing protein [Bacteroides fragilis]QCQ44184.1 DUF1566 domain-containing protein [Bacteroides fragilis]QLK81431.1 DUF1566 domain-containing protein [Bacteroides sp. PHL 2737]
MNRTFIMRECLGKALWLCFCLSIAGCAEDDRMTPLSADSGDTADELIPIHISLTGDNNYHSSSFNDASPRNHSPLIAEWVGVKAFSPTRTGEQPDYEGPRIASMELTEDTLPCANTRATVPAGVYFRLIVFRKSGNNYVFQSAADYTSNGTGTPVLKQGKLLTRSGTIRVVGYSFNTTAAADLGTIPSTYAYNSSTVSIPNMSKDFMTFDSGDIANVNSLSHNLLPVSFGQKLCKLTITISPTGFPSNTISNCTGVYVKQGGNSTSWKIGPSTNVVAANTNNTAAFSPNTTLSTTIRMVPFAGARTITVHFNTLTISGRTVPNNTEITSTGSVQLKEGKSYTMKIQFKKAIGINVPSGSINLTANGCSATDKTNLAKLTWADGNLKSTGSANYVWGTYSEYGYYYPWYKDYSGNNIDPCTRLKSDYGTGWRTPSRNECLSLSRCTDKAAVTSGGNKGMWFMNNSKGLFLPLAGARTWSGGSGTTATESGYARYWTSTNNSSSIAYSLNFENNKAEVNSSTKGDGFSVRCVK